MLQVCFYVVCSSAEDQLVRALLDSSVVDMEGAPAQGTYPSMRRNHSDTGFYSCPNLQFVGGPWSFPSGPADGGSLQPILAIHQLSTLLVPSSFLQGCFICANGRFLFAACSRLATMNEWILLVVAKDASQGDIDWHSVHLLNMVLLQPQLLMWHDGPKSPYADDHFQLIFHACRRIIPHLPPPGCRVHRHFHFCICKDDRIPLLPVGHGRHSPWHGTPTVEPMQLH